MLGLGTLHVGPLHWLLELLTAWWLGPYSERSTEAAGKSYIVFYGLTSEVTLYPFCPNCEIQGEEINGRSIKVILSKRTCKMEEYVAEIFEKHRWPTADQQEHIFMMIK